MPKSGTTKSSEKEIKKKKKKGSCKPLWFFFYLFVWLAWTECFSNNLRRFLTELTANFSESLLCMSWTLCRLSILVYLMREFRTCSFVRSLIRWEKCFLSHRKRVRTRDRLKKRENEKEKAYEKIRWKNDENKLQISHSEKDSQTTFTHTWRKVQGTHEVYIHIIRVFVEQFFFNEILLFFSFMRIYNPTYIVCSALFGLFCLLLNLFSESMSVDGPMFKRE